MRPIHRRALTRSLFDWNPGRKSRLTCIEASRPCSDGSRKKDSRSIGWSMRRVVPSMRSLMSSMRGVASATPRGSRTRRSRRRKDIQPRCRGDRLGRHATTRISCAPAERVVSCPGRTQAVARHSARGCGGRGSGRSAPVASGLRENHVSCGHWWASWSGSVACSEPVMPVRILTQLGPGQAMTSACTLRCHGVPGGVRRFLALYQVPIAGGEPAEISLPIQFEVRILDYVPSQSALLVRGTSESRPLKPIQTGLPLWLVSTAHGAPQRISESPWELGGRRGRRPDPGCDSHRRRRTSSPDSGAA